MSNKTEGLRRKYRVERTDGGMEKVQKHQDCFKFVLDPTHDPIARVALIRYMNMARDEGYIKLADDLHRALNPKEFLPVVGTYGLVIGGRGWVSGNYGPWCLEGDMFVSAEQQHREEHRIPAWEVEKFVPLTAEQIKILRPHG